jgi:membrane-associated phospholipid phosphatase
MGVPAPGALVKRKGTAGARRSVMTDSKLASKLLFGTAALAALGFAAVSAAVARGKTSRLDKRAQGKWHASNGSAWQGAARGTTPLGKWWGQLPAALVTAKGLQKRQRTAAALTVVGSSIGGILLSEILDRLMRHRQPPPERGEPAKQSYPSGHALQSSALALTTGYVLWREGLAPKWSAAPLSALSAAAGAGRLLLDRHWTSDVIGGYCAGIALGATCAGCYELALAH